MLAVLQESEAQAALAAAKPSGDAGEPSYEDDFEEYEDDFEEEEEDPSGSEQDEEQATAPVEPPSRASERRADPPHPHGRSTEVYREVAELHTAGKSSNGTRSHVAEVRRGCSGGAYPIRAGEF
jgi:hypothetical protein